MLELLFGNEGYFAQLRGSDRPALISKDTGHGTVGDSGFQIFLALRAETLALVKTDGRILRMQAQHRLPARSRLLDERAQQSHAYPAAAPGREHGHAPYMRIGQQPSGTDRPALIIVGNGMDAARVAYVQFQRGIYALLPNKDLQADTARVRPERLPIAGTHARHEGLRRCLGVTHAAAHG